MQVWIDRVADDESYRDLRGRLQADDADHYSALLELYLHELMVRASYRVYIHPELPNSRRRPDFLVVGHGHSFYLEAIHPGPQPEAHGRSQRRAALLDSIQRCSNRNFFLSLDELVVGPDPAPGKRVRRELERWLDRLDPDNTTYDLDHRETYRWQAEGWSAEFSAIPITREHRGRSDHRAIGVYADGGVSFIDDAPTIQSALDVKATAYGQLDQPLVIALGTYIWDRDRWHSTNALYGRAAVTWWEDEKGVVRQAETRQPDGFFGTPPDWANGNVAAVLHVNQLQPTHVHRTELTLWPHPQRAEEMAPLAKRIPAVSVGVSEGRLQTEDPPVDSSMHFSLPNPWPAGEAFPHE